MGFDNRRSNGTKIDPKNARDPQRVARCTAEHPAWFLYHERVEGGGTVLRCRRCEEESNDRE